MKATHNGINCQADPKIHLKMQETQISQNNLRKEERSWRTDIS